MTDWNTWNWTSNTCCNSDGISYTIYYALEYFTLEEALYIAEQFHAEQMGW